VRHNFIIFITYYYYYHNHLCQCLHHLFVTHFISSIVIFPQLSGSHGEWTQSDDTYCTISISLSPNYHFTAFFINYSHYYKLSHFTISRNGSAPWTQSYQCNHHFTTTSEVIALVRLIAASNREITNLDLFEMAVDTLLRITNDHQVSSSLNGNNGEVTNSDDTFYLLLLLFPLFYILFCYYFMMNLKDIFKNILFITLSIISFNILLFVTFRTFLKIFPHFIMLTYRIIHYFVIRPWHNYLIITRLNSLGVKFFICCTQLNGNNGEATNTDDTMNEKKNKNDARKRTRKEANTHKFSRNPGAGGKCNYGPRGELVFSGEDEGAETRVYQGKHIPRPSPAPYSHTNINPEHFSNKNGTVSMPGVEFEVKETLEPSPPDLVEVKIYYNFQFIESVPIRYLLLFLLTYLFTWYVYHFANLFSFYKSKRGFIGEMLRESEAVLFDKAFEEIAEYNLTIIPYIKKLLEVNAASKQDDVTDHALYGFHPVITTPDQVKDNCLVYDPLCYSRTGYTLYRNEIISMVLLRELEKTYPHPELTDKSVGIFEYQYANTKYLKSVKESTALYYYQYCLANTARTTGAAVHRTSLLSSY